MLSRIFAKRETSEPLYPATRRVGYSPRSLAGPVITPDTAVTISAAWACLRYLSQTVAVLPWHVMQADPQGRKLLKTSHPVDYLLNVRPNPEWSAFQFKETLTHWALRWGNGYAEIERDTLGRPIALWPIEPNRVLPQRDLDTGRLVFKITNGVNGSVTLDYMDVFHVRGFGEGPVGVNVVEYAAESLGWAKAAQLFGAAFFGNGMNLGGFVETKQNLKPEGLQALRARLKQKFVGPRKALQWEVLDAGMAAKPFAIEPDKGQFIETNQYLVEEVCRWFGVPPHKVAHLLRATFSNIENQAIEVVVDSIHPWVKRFEDEGNFKLFGPRSGGFYTKMNMRALLRGDFKSQQEGLEVMRRNGVINADKWCELVDMDEIGDGNGGDKYIVQAQYVELKNVGVAPAAAPVSAPGKESGAEDEPDGDPFEPDDNDPPADGAADAEDAAAQDRIRRRAEELIHA